MKTRILLLFTLLCAAMASLQSVDAATFTVQSTGDGAATPANCPGAGCRLRDALAAVNDGDTIDFGAAVTGTITLSSGELLVSDSITISGPGATILAVNGNAASRVFHIASGKTVTISGLTLTNGHANIGGGIYNDHATLTINNSSVSGNSAASPDGDGGGIYNDHAMLTVSNSTISGNSGVRPGGGRGGGIFNDRGTLALNDSTISGNSVNGLAGGIFNEGRGSSAAVTINDSTISGNSALAGGGVLNDGALGSVTLAISNSTLSSNSATLGGGIYNDGNSGSATLTATNSTLSGNSAASGGGGIYQRGNATLTLRHTILKSGASSANVTDGMVTSLGYNLSSDAAGGDATIGPGGFLNQTGDIRNTDPMLGPLQNNGGTTYTHALLSCSPAINRGDPNFTPPPNYDQRGADYARVINGRIDIGSFEVQEVQPCYGAQIQQPINADGTSVFNVRRGVVPVKFTLTADGVATCNLPPATIAVTRTAGGTTGPIDESIYSGPADTGSNFRIDSCQYIYNLSASALGAGTYQVDIIINTQVVGSATFALR